MTDTTTHQKTDPTLDFGEILQEIRLPLRLIDAGIGGVAEAGDGDPVRLLLRANEDFGNDLWSALGTALYGLKELSKAHDAECARMMELGDLTGFRSAVTHYLGADVCTSMTNEEIRTISREALDLLVRGRMAQSSPERLAGTIDRLLTVLRHRLRSGSAAAQLEQARSLIEEALATEEAVRAAPPPDPEPPRAALDVIADGAAAAFERGDSEEKYLAALLPGQSTEILGETMREYRDQLVEEGRWPWAEISPGNNGSPHPIPIETEQAKKLARFDKLVAGLSPERKVALLDRLEGALAIGGRIRRSPQQDLKGDDELRELLRNDPGGALRTLLPAFFAADDERRRHLIALVDDVQREGRDDDAVA